ncbi:MAG: hypothetical protein V1793_09955 [Pseudomonadota bacterium]
MMVDKSKDSQDFLRNLEETISHQESDILGIVISRFLDYYMLHETQWRVITHFALHGKKDNASPLQQGHCFSEKRDYH